MKDTYWHKGMRRQLVKQLRQKGITDEKVLAAITAVPRHFFLDNVFIERAYEDKAFPIGNDQTISQPFTVAFQTMLLEVKKREKILEIGTGSGYQAAILAYLGARVYTIERQESLFKKSTLLLKKMGFGSIRTFFRDGYNGLGEFAPFDKIIVTAAAKEIPKPLLEQLAIGGHLVIPVGTQKGQKMYKITRMTETDYKTKIYGNFRFVPFKSGTEKEN